MVSRQADAGAVVVAYQRQTEQLRQRLGDLIAQLWRSLDSYRDPAPFVGRVVPLVTGAQMRMASLTAAYLAAVRQISAGGTGTPVAVLDSRVTGAVTRNGTPLTDVYERPFHTVWRELHDLPREAGAVDRAIQAGLDQALVEARTDVQRTKALTARETFAADRHVAGYRRVLEGARSCGLCVVASTQRYHKADLLPIHPGCDCAVAPIYGEEDPGQVIDEQRLAAAHQAVAERFGRSDASARGRDGVPAYRDVLIVHQHGELGPVLGVRGQGFTGPSDLR